MRTSFWTARVVCTDLHEDQHFRPRRGFLVLAYLKFHHFLHRLIRLFPLFLARPMHRRLRDQNSRRHLDELRPVHRDHEHHALHRLRQIALSDHLRQLDPFLPRHFHSGFGLETALFIPF